MAWLSFLRTYLFRSLMKLYFLIKVAILLLTFRASLLRRLIISNMQIPLYAILCVADIHSLSDLIRVSKCSRSYLGIDFLVLKVWVATPNRSQQHSQ